MSRNSLSTRFPRFVSLIRSIGQIYEQLLKLPNIIGERWDLEGIDELEGGKNDEKPCPFPSFHDNKRIVGNGLVCSFLFIRKDNIFVVINHNSHL